MADYLSDCNQGELRTDAKSFQDVWCARCREKGCSLAKWSKDRFESRTADAMDRFFNRRRQGDISIPKFAQIAAIDFPDLTKKVRRLEASAKANDWNVPEIPITDGRIITAEQDTTDHVDEAIRKLAEAEGRQPQELPEPVSNNGDDEVIALDDETIPQPDLPESRPEAIPAPQHPKTGPIARPKRGNTEMPSELMVGGGQVKAPTPEGDPWAAPKRDSSKRVEPGATIQFGTGGVIDDT